VTAAAAAAGPSERPTMTPIRSLDQLVAQLQDQPSRRVAVAAGHDPNTIQAAARAVAEDIAEVILVGDHGRIAALCAEDGLDLAAFTVVDEPDEARAGAEAVRLVRDGEADVLMKGLIGTEKYMRLILDKERGLLPPKAVLSHVTVLDIPAYRASQDKLLIVGDVAIIPDPDLETKVKIVRYVIEAAHAFGIAEPRVALIAATEKVNPKMTACVDAAVITQMNRRGQIPGAIVDGPLALDVACSPEACAIKGLQSPVGGSADCLVFPNLETGNVFYKATTLLGGARLAAAVVGTTAPCVLTSRADSEESKFLSIALGCRLVR
jgi:phosphate butyryltransferase